MPAPHAHCSFCGARFPEEADWPRTCPACGSTTYRNPLPVAVAVVPVAGGGLLAVRRAIPPAGLALPGGFVELGESWQEAAARELAEETGVRADPAAFREVRVLSAPDGTLLVFGRAPEIAREALGAFAPSPEVAGLEVLRSPSDDIVFPLHRQVVAEVLGGA
jgi:8-oxo-dGTP pyrophosphatase MutT (NUDIX family)